jgi:hypothetical protein
LVTPAAQRSIERGLKWLAGRQHDDGSFGTGQFRGNAAIAALAGMALVSGGSTPGRGPYGREVDRCVGFLLASSRPSGFIAGGDSVHGPMYGHGFATTFLAECYGMSPRFDLREKLARAVNIIVGSQNKLGGWRYQPVREDTADVSVTSCQIMALRAARNAGLFVPNETVDRAIGYLKRCQNADGGFRYMIEEGASAFPRSAAAVAALQSAGVYRGAEIAKGLDYILRSAAADNSPRQEGYYFYGQYYAAQAVWQAGGQRWSRWYGAARDELISAQSDNGSWQGTEGGECSTAMACIVLEMPNNYLPIFQR